VPEHALVICMPGADGGTMGASVSFLPIWFRNKHLGEQLGFY
jgi:hypothetical protein